MRRSFAKNRLPVRIKIEEGVALRGDGKAIQRLSLLGTDSEIHIFDLENRSGFLIRIERFEPINDFLRLLLKVASRYPVRSDDGEGVGIAECPIQAGLGGQLFC